MIRKAGFRFWVLDGHTPVGTNDVVEWSRMFDDTPGGRAVGKTEIGDVYVSTVFLGVDHSFSTGGPPILFETMVFRGPLDECQWRYATWAEAEAGHAAVVAAVRAGITDPDEVPL